MRQKSSRKGMLALLWLCAAGLAQANTLPAHQLCDRAAQVAAQNTAVPLSVLLSIARVESGRLQDGRFAPWPWAANMSGQSYFFETQGQAIAFAADQIAKGNINFDVGCFQVNLRWHSRGFPSLEAAYDPQSNANYAAQFLAALYQEKGSWDAAVATYHSRTKIHASRYLEKVKATWHKLYQTPNPAPPVVDDPRPLASVNNFPLLRHGIGVNGSLVPQQIDGEERGLLR